MEKCEKHSAHEVLMETLKGEIDGVKLSVGKLYKGQSEMSTELALVTDKVEGMGHIAEAVLRLSIAVENGNADTKKALADIANIVGSHEKDIKDIKESPGKRAIRFNDVVTGLVVATFIGGGLTLLFQRIVQLLGGN